MPNSINGTSEADSINNTLSGVIIQVFGGNDSIQNNAANVSIFAGDGNDSIRAVDSDSVVVDAGNGNDTIKNEQSNYQSYKFTIDGGAGDDYIYHYKESAQSSINGGAGNDSISNTASLTAINGGADNDTISNSGANVTINGGAGNDTISNNAKESKIYGGAGDDTIYNSGANVTIDGGAGDDSISNSANNVVFQYFGGNDVIQGFNNSSTLQILSGNIESAGSNCIDATLKIGDNTVLLKGLGKNNVINLMDAEGNVTKFSFPITIMGSDEDDTINNTFSNVPIQTFEGNDSIYSYNQTEVTIESGGGNDTVNNNSGSNASIVTGEGDDSIYNSGSNAKIEGGKGDDSIQNHSTGSTIDGGAGDDSIYNSNISFSTSINGGDDNDTIRNWANNNVTIEGGKGDDSISNERAPYTTISGGDGNDTIENKTENSYGNTYSSNNVSIDGGVGDDYIFNSGYNSTINGGADNDTISNSANNVVFQYSGGNDLIQGFNNSSTLQILSGSLSSARSDGTNVFLTIGENEVTLKNVGQMTQINVIHVEGNSEILNVPMAITGSDGDDAITNNRGNTFITALDGNDTISSSGDNTSIFAGSGNDFIRTVDSDSVIIDAGEGNDTIRNEQSSYRSYKFIIDAGAGDDYIYHHKESSQSSINGGAGNDSIEIYSSSEHGTYGLTVEGGDGNDSIVASGRALSNLLINAGADDDTIYNSGANSTIDAGTGNDIITNNGANSTIDAGTGNDIITNNGANSTIDAGDNDDTIDNNVDNALILAGNGNDSIRVMNSDSVIVDAGDGNDTIINEHSNYRSYKFSINGGAGDDYIYHYKESSQSSINGGAGNDTIQINSGDEHGTYYLTVEGGEGNDSIVTSGRALSNLLINAGDDDDTISNITSNSTIIGGKGDDSIVNTGSNVLLQYAAGDGNDLIEGFNETSTLQITEGQIDALGFEGNDFLLTFGQDTVTLKNALDFNKVTIIDKDGNGIDFSEPTNEDDVILNNASDVTIDAGEGNNVISNNAPNVLIRHAGGNDKIIGFNKSSTLQLFDDIKKTTTNGKDVFVTVTKPDKDVTVTLKNAFDGGKQPNIVDKDGKEIEIELEGEDTDNKKVNLNVYHPPQGESVITGSGKDKIMSSWSDGSIGSFILTGSGDDIIHNNAPYSTIYGGANADSIYACPTAIDNNINGGSGNDTINVDGAGATINGGTGDDIISNYGASAFIDGGADNDYLYNDGILPYSYEQALQDVAEKVRDASKAELEDILYQFNIDPDLKSIIKDGENSSFLANLDSENARRFADAIKATKEFAEASLAYQTEKSGKNYVNLLSGNVDYANKFLELTGYALTGKERSLYETAKRMVTDGKKANAVLEMKQYEAVGKFVDKVGIGVAALKAGLKYATYSETVDFYERRKQNIWDNMTEENMQESFRQLEAIDRARAQAGAEVSAEVVYGVGNAILGVILGGAGAAQGAAIGAVVGTAICPVAGTAIGAAIGGIGGAFAVSWGVNSATEWAKNVYMSGDHPYIGNYLPTWKEITGQKQRADVQVSFNVQAPLEDVQASFDVQAPLANVQAPVLMSSFNAVDVVEVAKATIKGSSGDDAIINRNTLVFIDGGADDDAIFNYGSKVSVQSGDGQNVISNTGDNVSITAGADNDRIENGGDNVIIETGFGNDYVVNDADDIEIKALEGDNTINSYAGKNIAVDAGAGDDSIVNAMGSSITIDAGDGDNVIENYGGTEVQINSGSGEDYIKNYGENVTINSGASSDIIINEGANVNINSEDGNDIIINNGSTVLIDGGAGDDAIINGGNNVSINGGNGDDIILNTGSDVTITGGAGNDIFIHHSGNNVITDFSVNDTLQISDVENYSTQQRDNDIVVYFGENMITLSGAASLQSINIELEEKDAWKLNDFTATYGTSKETLITISGVKSLDGISLNDKVVTISKAALGTSNVSINNGYTLALGNDVDEPLTIAAGWSLNETTATYKAASTLAGYKLADNQIIYEGSRGGETLFTLTGATINNAIEVDTTNKTVTLTASNLNKKNVIVDGDNYKLTLASDVDTQAETIEEVKDFKDGKLNYTASGVGEYYKIDGEQIVYTPATPRYSFTLSGLKTSDGVTINGSEVTVNDSAFDMTAATAYTVKLDGDKFTLNFNANTSTAETPATLENGNYTSTYTPAHFTGSGKEYTFTPATAPTTFTISGLGSGAKLGENVTIDDKTIKISVGALTATHEKISVDDSSYTLQLNNSLVADIPFAQDGTKITLSGKTAGYKLVNGEYVWQAQVDGEELTITGLKDGATLTEKMFTRDGDKITFKPTDELLPDNPTTITISDGVIDTSALTTTAKVDAHWSGTTYISKQTDSSWTTNAATVTYTASTGGEELFTLDNLKAGVTVDELTAAIDVDGATIKIKSDEIFDTAKKVTAPEGYAFKLVDTNGHYVFHDGNSYALATTDNTTNYSNLIRVHEVTLPEGVTVTSGISATADGKTYAAGEITLSDPKTGYTIASTATITADTTITPALDDTNHYIFGTEGNYTVATANNVKTNNYPDLTQVYKVTVPEGVNITSDKYAVGSDIYVAANAQVTIAATDTNKLIKSATVEGGTLANGVYTLTATKDLEITAPILIWNFAKIFTDADGTSNNPYTLDTAAKLGYLTDNIAVGENYSGKYFKLTSGIGSDAQNIGDATNQFKGTAILESGVKVSFNAGATIEVTSGEISFNADTSTFGILNSGDKFKVDETEYTVGDGCILQSGKVWLNPAQVTIDGLSTENNWTATVDGTITLSATNETIYFYGTDGKKVASFDGSTLTKENDSSTAITAIDASALTSAITINGFYNENTTITAGTGGVNVNVDGNKFSVVNGAFKFDGSKLISGTATLSTANDAVKVGDNLIKLTAGDGITVNASDSTIGGLNSGDKFTIGTDSYEVVTNGIIKNNSAIHATAENLAISSDNWTAATIITDNAITLGSDTTYFDSTAKKIAKLESGTLTALDATVATNLTVEVGTGNEYTLGKEFSNLKSSDNSFKVTSTGEYKVNGITITLANVTGLEIGGVNYSVDTEKISKTISGNTYHLTKSDTVTTSALTGDDNWTLHSGAVTVTNSLTTTDGKTLAVAGDSDGVKVTVANGSITSITGLASGGSVTYEGKTYKHTINLPTGATATGDNLEINGKDYYATGTTVTVSGFTSGEISFDSSITNLAQSDDSIVAKVGENIALTISGLTYPTEDGNDWTVSGNYASYLKKLTAGAAIDGEKITYKSASTETLFTLSNSKNNVTVDEVKSAIEVGDDKTITIKDSTILEDGATLSVDNNYSVELSSTLAPSNPVSAGWNGTSYYSADGYKTTGWTLDNGKVTQVNSVTPAVTVENVPSGATVSNDTIEVSGNTVTVKSANLVGAKITATGYNIGVAENLKSKADITAGWNGTSYYTTAGSSEDYYEIVNSTVTKVAASKPAFTVNGVKSNSGLNLNGTTVTVSNASLDGKDVTISGNDYSLALGNDVIKSSTTNAGWAFSNNVATYKDSSTSAGYKLADNKISYVEASGGETLASVTGVKSLDGVSLNGKVVTVSNASLDGKDVTISGNDYSLALGNDVTKSSTTNAAWSAVSSGKATYTYDSTTAGYSLVNNKITYTKAVAAKSFSLSGIKSTSGIKVDGSTVTINAANLNKKAITISDGYTLKLADDVAAPVETKAGWSKVSSGKATYTYDSTTAGYSLVNNKITYTKAVAAKSFSLSGIKSTSGIKVDGSTVTLKAANLNKKAITISDGYTLKLADDVAAPVETKAGWSKVSSGKATYTYDSTTAGYSLVNNKITYTKAVAAKSFSLSGIKSTSGIKVDGSTVTLKAANLNKKAITISDGYTLKLADDVAAPVETKAGWSKVSSGKATYTYDSTTAGYSLANNKIAYTVATAPKSFTLSGIKSTSGIKVDGSTVTINAANLNKKAITISDGYTLKLADDVAAPVETKAGWSKVSSGKATYNFASTTAGYSLANNKIAYTVATAPKSFTLSGIKSTSGIKVDGSTVTINAANLNKKAITISDGYTLKLADDVAAPVETKAGWSKVSSGKATYTYDSTTAGYSLANNKVTYTKAVADKSFTLSGIKSTSGIKVDGSTVTLKAANLNKKAITISDGYTLKLADDVAAPKTLAPTWTVNDTNATLHLNTSAGYTIENNKIVYNAKKTGDAQISLSGLAKNAKLALPEKNTLTLEASVLGTNTSIESNAGGYTVKLTGDMKGKKFVGTSKADTLSIAAQNASVEGGKGNDKLLGSANNDSLNGGSGNDTLSGGKGNDKLYGGKGNDSLVGGDGADTLSGDAGNDKITGGKGNDTFVFSGGKDTITDYAAGDKVSVASSLGKGKFSVSSKNVIMTYGSNTLTITNGLDKEITFINGATGTYKTAGIFNKDNMAVTLPAATKTFDATKYSALVTVDASAANSTIKITGNTKANVLTAGANGSTLDGGKGNDTLNGGAGKDSLVGGVDNDKLLGNAGNDTLSGGDGADTLSGGAGNDKLYGGKGNDSLWGGAGNDSLWGGAGKDVFVYKPNEGTDTIFDYASGDMLKILKTNGKEGGSFTKSSFSNNKLTLTISGGGSVVFDGVKSGDAFNINGTTHTLSGKKLK